MKTPDWAKQICDSFGMLGVPPAELPKYRILWAPERTQLCFGKLRKLYNHLGDKWIVEVLIPWEKFGEWHEAAMGPKPLYGEYCHAFTVPWEENGASISLEDFGMESIRLVLTCIERGKMIQPWQIMNYHKRMEEQAEKEFHQEFSDRWNDAVGVGLVGGPIGENAVSGIPGKKTSADKQIVQLEDLTPEEQARFNVRPGGIRQIS